MDPAGAADLTGFERVGVFGGSFDPIHRGHLHVAVLAREAARLDAVLFVPAAEPPHKERARLAPAVHRVEMLRRGLAGEGRTAISLIELEPGGPRYTADTLEAIAQRMPGVRLHFILGMDSLIDLPKWRGPERILGRHRVVAVDRPGFDPHELDPEIAAQCRLVFGNPLAISATVIRDRLSRGLSVRHLVPRAVNAYIRDRGLYSSEARRAQTTG